jgi:mannose-6-phosphate isomerase-like protein (cupin superfamily)
MELVEKSDDKAYGVLLVNGTLELGYYKPDGIDPQQPHAQDEIYVVQSGSGYFVLDDHRQPFETGEALFVPAGAVHRFENFTDDFAAWVVFYGPEGGE